MFRNIDFNSEANLGRTRQRNERLKHLLEDFHDPRLDLRPSRIGNQDIIGDAYEYLIGKFASGAGKKQCRTCGGVGQVISSRGFFQIQQTCPDCDGAGETVADPCKSCRGSGRQKERHRIRLKVPAGIEEGTQLRSTGNGDLGMKGGPAGDLYVLIHLRPHDVFERDSHDLHCDMPISFATAALGGELEVPTLVGKATVKIPGGTQNATTFRLRGKGMKVLGRDQFGDLYVHVQIAVPNKLTTEQREKLQEFAKALGENNSPLHESFFAKAKKFFS